MKLKIELTCREDNYEKRYKAILIDQNIVVDENNILPNSSGKLLNFISDYSPAYNVSSNGKVNTRFRYIYNSRQQDNNYIYAKLNWIQRQKLAFINRQSWFHKNPVATWALIFNTLFAFVNLGFACMNYFNSVREIQSSYIQTINNQIELQKQQSDQYAKNLDLVMKYQLKELSQNDADTILKKKETIDSLKPF